MKEIKIFRCEVDLYRNGTVFRDSSNRLYGRNTKGVYSIYEHKIPEIGTVLDVNKERREVIVDWLEG